MYNETFSIILISVAKQEMKVSTRPYCMPLPNSTEKWRGEKMDSECTPRGCIKSNPLLAWITNQQCFVAREWTGEIYTPELAEQFPGRDWILTRILRLEVWKQEKIKVMM